MGEVMGYDPTKPTQDIVDELFIDPADKAEVNEAIPAAPEQVEAFFGDRLIDTERAHHDEKRAGWLKGTQKKMSQVLLGLGTGLLLALAPAPALGAAPERAAVTESVEIAKVAVEPTIEKSDATQRAREYAKGCGTTIIPTRNDAGESILIIRGWYRKNGVGTIADQDITSSAGTLRMRIIDNPNGDVEAIKITIYDPRVGVAADDPSATFKVVKTSMGRILVLQAK